MAGQLRTQFDSMGEVRLPIDDARVPVAAMHCSSATCYGFPVCVNIRISNRLTCDTTQQRVG